MPVRATKRGRRAHAPLRRVRTSLICGASFAGLAVARELAGSGARVLVIDRYEIGERQTSACAAPTELARRTWAWRTSIRQTLRRARGPHAAAQPSAGRCRSRSRPSTTGSCASCCGRSATPTFETAKVDGSARGDTGPHRPRRPAAPLVVDALGWRRVLSTAPAIQPPDARCRAASRSIRPARATTSSCGSTRSTSARLLVVVPGRRRAARRASARSTRASTSRSRRCAWPTTSAAHRDGYQGNWIPHQLRAAIEDGVFFVGDSAGHCLPTTAEGIRPALYFGARLGRELRAVVEGRQTREQALRALPRAARRDALRLRGAVPRAAVDPRTSTARCSTRSPASSTRRGSVRWALPATTSTSRRRIRGWRRRSPSAVGRSHARGPEPAARRSPPPGEARP